MAYMNMCSPVKGSSKYLLPSLDEQASVSNVCRVIRLDAQERAKHQEVHSFSEARIRERISNPRKHRIVTSGSKKPC